MDKNGRMWLLVLVLAVVILADSVPRLVEDIISLSGSPRIESIKASEFYNMVENRPEDISSMQISKDWIKGTYSAPRQGYTDFRTPRDPQFPLEETLLASNIGFDYQEPSRFPEWLGFLTGGLLPPLLLIGLLLVIVFMYKRDQKGTKEVAGTSIPNQIEQLASLKDQGILSEEEFEEKKKELLSKM